jgi:hypothetical protein
MEQNFLRVVGRPSCSEPITPGVESCFVRWLASRILRGIATLCLR